MKKAKLFGIKYFIYDFAKITGGLPALLWFRPKFIYENESAKNKISGGALIMSNHTKLTDPVLLMLTIWYRRHHFICTKELMKGATGFWLKHFMCIPIDRENFGIGSFRQITEHLEAGEIVSIFPEGAIKTSENEVDAFKDGMVMMAATASAPIVPIYLENKKGIFDRARVVIGEPVSIKDICGGRPSLAQIKELSEALRQKEIELKKLV